MSGVVLYYQVLINVEWDGNILDANNPKIEYHSKNLCRHNRLELGTNTFLDDKSKEYNCYHFPRSRTSLAHILLPRRLWNNFLGCYRRLFPESHNVQNFKIPKRGWGPACAGPHITFLDPFVQDIYFDECAEKLTKILSDFPPFTIRLEEFEIFAQKDGYVIYLLPQTDPPNALQELLRRALTVFPQCNDQLTHHNKPPYSVSQYRPHVSVAKTKNKSPEALEKWNLLLKNHFKPMKWTLREITLMSRPNINYRDEIYEIKKTVFLGTKLPNHKKKFRWGWESLTESMKKEPMGCTIVIQNLPPNVKKDGMQTENVVTSVDLFLECEKKGWNPMSCTVLRKYEKARRVGLVEFSSHEQCMKILKNGGKELFGGFGVFILPLWACAFPNEIESWSVEKDFTRYTVFEDRVRWKQLVQDNESNFVSGRAVMELDLLIQTFSAEVL